MNIYIIRNNQRFGPYDEQILLDYVNSGQVLCLGLLLLVMYLKQGVNYQSKLRQ